MDGYIGKDLIVRGRIGGEGDLAIDGTVHGEIDLHGRIELGAPGLLAGEVHCTELCVEGEVRAPVSANAVQVRAGGWIAGDVRTERLSIDDEGAVQGAIHMEFELPANDRGAR